MPPEAECAEPPKRVPITAYRADAHNSGLRQGMRWRARCVRAQTSPYLWLLTSVSVIPAILFWNHTALLMGFCVAFVVCYCQLYWSIVHFRSPKWLMRLICRISCDWTPLIS